MQNLCVQIESTPKRNFLVKKNEKKQGFPSTSKVGSSVFSQLFLQLHLPTPLPPVLAFFLTAPPVQAVYTAMPPARSLVVPDFSRFRTQKILPLQGIVVGRNPKANYRLDV